MAEEAGVHAGVAKGECFAVDLDGAVVQGSDEVFCGALEGEEVGGLFPSVQGGDGDEGFDRGVACSCAVNFGAARWSPR